MITISKMMNIAFLLLRTLLPSAIAIGYLYVIKDMKALLQKLRSIVKQQ